MRSSAIVAITLIFLGSALCGNNFHIETCSGTPETLIHIDSYSIDGDICSNCKITLHMTGTVFLTTTIDNADIKAYLGAVKVYSGNQHVGMATTAGPDTISQEITLPSGIPKGNYKVNAILKTASGQVLQCFDATGSVTVEGEKTE